MRGDRPRRPELSVVIASVNGYPYLAQCLDSLSKQTGKDRAEVIVAAASGVDTAARVTADFPWARLVLCNGPRTIPALRAVGIRQARADIVVTTSDRYAFDEGWYERILEAHAGNPRPAIGGAVENGSRERLVDWAVYLCEYGKFMLPFPAGPALDLAGPNVSYKRAVLEEICGDLLDSHGAWEGALHARLRERGMELWIDPSIVVYHANAPGFWKALTQRYYFGRSFAAARVQAAPAHVRAFFVAICLLLPPLFLWRYARYCVTKRRFVRDLVKTSPLLVLFAAAWSIGEFFGYAFGDGRASLQVR